MGTQSKSAMRKPNEKTQPAVVPPKKTEDRLAEAIVKKIEVLTIAGRELKIHKWNYWTSMRLASPLTQLIEKVFATMKGKVDIVSLMGADIGDLLSANAKDVLEIIVGTIERGNFPDEAATREWAEEELGLAEVMDVVMCIGRQNLRPLVKKIHEVTGVDVSGRAEALRASLAQTSSPNSSKEDTPTKG